MAVAVAAPVVAAAVDVVEVDVAVAVDSYKFIPLAHEPRTLIPARHITAPVSWGVWCFGFVPYGWCGKDEEI